MAIRPPTFTYPTRAELERDAGRPELLAKVHDDLNARFAEARSAYLAVEAVLEELRGRGFQLHPLDGDGATFLAFVDDGTQRELERRFSIWFRFGGDERSIAIELAKPRAVDAPHCPYCALPMHAARVVHVDAVRDGDAVGSPVRIEVIVGEEREVFHVHRDDAEVTFRGWSCASCGAAVFGGRNPEPDCD